MTGKRVYQHSLRFGLCFDATFPVVENGSYDGVDVNNVNN